MNTNIYLFNQYTIKDELSQFLPTLVPFQEDAQAKRWFRDYVAGNTMMKNNPEDYSLWKVGSFDAKEGTLDHLPFPELIERAKGAVNVSSENKTV